MHGDEAVQKSQKNGKKSVCVVSIKLQKEKCST